jgi:hypothetical protein
MTTNTQIVDEIRREMYVSAKKLSLDTRNIFVVNEEAFSKNKEVKTGTMYILVRFGKATVDGVQTLQPVTLSTVSTGNAILPSQDLLTQFVSDYNLQVDTAINGLQIWTTPTVIGNFNEVGADYRSTFESDGTFVLSSFGQFMTLTGPDGKSIFLLDADYAHALNPDPQPYATTGGVTVSKPMSYTRNLTVVTYPLSSSAFVASVLDAAMSDDSAVMGQTFSITISVGAKTTTRNMVLTEAHVHQKLGSLGSLSFSMTDTED